VRLNAVFSFVGGVSGLGGKEHRKVAFGVLISLPFVSLSGNWSGQAEKQQHVKSRRAHSETPIVSVFFWRFCHSARAQTRNNREIQRKICAAA
jgi:hypothetical protein